MDSQPEVSSSMGEVNNKPMVYLTLGDGDFTYSLDLVRYLKLSSENPESSVKRKPVKLILTGVDEFEALISKYKDSPSILQEIRNQESERLSLSLTIRHGVNAIVNPNEKMISNEHVHEAADHVLFHHPHLGTENCNLHKRFLAHLFHSVENHWMKKNGGIFHLTLVQGQYDRWQCKEQAERHGLELIQKSPFSPPPLKTLMNIIDTKTKEICNINRYHYRRHQTGKSFATRRPNSHSITYTFGRTIDKGMYVATTLPWQIPDPSSSDIKTQPKTLSSVKSSMFVCSFCNKEFSEKRSLKCHLRDKHSSTEVPKEESNGREQPRKKTKLETAKTSTKMKISTFPCLLCQPQRIFQSEKALQSHVRAKHVGIYTYIAPDWSIAKTKKNLGDEDAFAKGETRTNSNECRICGFKLIGQSLSRHFRDFLPVDGLQEFACDFCSKLFREERAKFQHMNFCSKRGT